MTEPTLTSFEPDEAVYEQAAAWLVALSEPHDARAAQEFARWQEADPLHALAYEEISALREHVRPHALDAFERMPKLAPRPVGRMRRFALAASLVLVCTAGWANWNRISDLTADASTGVGERRQFRLADGSEVELNTDSALDLDFDGAGRSVRLRRGEAWFHVAKAGGKPFRVATSNALVTVTGTRFYVRRDNRQTRVAVEEGRVEVRPLAGGPPAVLTAGKGALVEGDRVQATPSADPLVAGAWRRGQLVFFEAPLGEVVRELNRYRSAPIVVLNGSLAARDISGVFNLADREGAVRAIEERLGVRAHWLPGGIVLIL
ncbi:MAG: FecR family protein [Candidatus Andeanibacterium colombiense]|uniref:FecR family protein n=1 Tax=Candidatus Andeanibacterium colombiense TaxID=3121345 RepID=A0AAJ6BLB7_9SPHN|nr:MAG: FecR family protein [Sphingomonadaceae bacterium]